METDRNERNDVFCNRDLTIATINMLRDLKYNMNIIMIKIKYIKRTKWNV